MATGNKRLQRGRRAGRTLQAHDAHGLLEALLALLHNAAHQHAQRIHQAQRHEQPQHWPNRVVEVIVVVLRRRKHAAPRRPQLRRGRQRRVGVARAGVQAGLQRGGQAKGVCVDGRLQGEEAGRVVLLSMAEQSYLEGWSHD